MVCCASSGGATETLSPFEEKQQDVFFLKSRNNKIKSKNKNKKSKSEGKSNNITRKI